MRFNQPAYATVHFSEKIWVKCPNCDNLGLVQTSLGKYTIPKPIGYKTKFECKHCFTQKTDHQEWFGYFQGTLHQACGVCGSKITFTSEPTKQPSQTTLIECDNCKNTKPYSLIWHKFILPTMPTDPFFGFDLWLQTNVKSNTLWLYNLEHLNYLRDYIRATLREDDGRHKYSMITNLPQWIKSAKNRPVLLKKLNALEIGLKKLTPIYE